jgi:hypothetical protein
MALLWKATLNPTKLELVHSFLRTRTWRRGPINGEVTKVAACRFDDPAGAVGIETLLARSGDGPIHHVPMTYREAPLDGGDDWLIGTADHSVLGKRWVYDACGDPVYAAAVAGAIATGAGSVPEFIQAPGGAPQPRPSTMWVRGSGQAGLPGAPPVTRIERVVDEDPTLIVTDSVELVVVRVVDELEQRAGAVLTGTWDGVSTPVLLAYMP